MKSRSFFQRLSVALFAPSLMLSAAAVAADQPADPARIRMFSAGTQEYVFDLYGVGPWKSLEGAQVAAPKANWQPVLYLKRFLSVNLRPLEPSTRLVKASEVPNASPRFGAYAGFGKETDLFGLGDTQMLLCPPGADVDANACALPASLVAVSPTKALINQPSNFSPWSQALWYAPMNAQVVVVAAEQRDALLAAQSEKVRANEAAWKQKQDLEDQKRQVHYTAQKVRIDEAVDEFTNAKKGKVLLCSSVQPASFQLASLTVRCATANGNGMTVSVSTALEQGWVIENQTLASNGMTNGNEYVTVNLVLRKR